MSWDEEAATWDDNEAVRCYAAAAFKSLEQTASAHGLDLAGASALDFGCGTGLLTEKLAGTCARVDAVDSSAAMLAVLQDKIARGGWSHVHTFNALPEAEGRHDLVLCSSVCAFLEDYPSTVTGLAGQLREGGLLLQWDWELDPEADEPFGLTREGIRAALQGAGLQVLSVDTGFSVPFEDQTMRPLLGVGRR